MRRKAILQLVCVLLAVATLSVGTTWWATSRSEARETSTARDDAPTATSVEEAGLSLVLPSRATADRPAPAGVPELPARFADPDDVTAEIQVRRGGQGSVARKTVTRSADRVHVRLGTDEKGPEWFFVQNPKDPRRVSGMMVDHHHRAILEYEETELRNTGIARGWADVVGLGVTPELFAELDPTGRERTVAGIEFAEYRPAPGAQSRARELWWSDATVTPLRLVTQDGTTQSEMVVRDLRREIDPALLRDPRERYPTYAEADIVDWREKVHEHGDEH